ncbi:MAG: hypothetical protein J2P40_13730 [Candidatus Dormibacteraeota bacterium]|nr:hypothetical protein [Candidatus Dormibacteraeota bacterium]MBO0762331.1 hypothetical protein [Candidatus Dormibacteraeota bacterium]
MRVVLGISLTVAAATLGLASAIHFGVPLIIEDPFAGAAIPEAILAFILAVGAASVWTRHGAAWGVALGTTLFALAGTGFGFSLTVATSRSGDIAYHVALLAVLVTAALLLLTPVARRALRPAA